MAETLASYSNTELGFDDEEEKAGVPLEDYLRRSLLPKLGYDRQNPRVWEVFMRAAGGWDVRLMDEEPYVRMEMMLPFEADFERNPDKRIRPSPVMLVGMSFEIPLKRELYDRLLQERNRAWIEYQKSSSDELDLMSFPEWESQMRYYTSSLEDSSPPTTRESTTSTPSPAPSPPEKTSSSS